MISLSTRGRLLIPPDSLNNVKISLVGLEIVTVQCIVRGLQTVHTWLGCEGKVWPNLASHDTSTRNTVPGGPTPQHRAPQPAPRPTAFPHPTQQHHAPSTRPKARPVTPTALPHPIPPCDWAICDHSPTLPPQHKLPNPRPSFNLPYQSNHNPLYFTTLHSNPSQLPSNTSHQPTNKKKKPFLLSTPTHHIPTPTLHTNPLPNLFLRPP